MITDWRWNKIAKRNVIILIPPTPPPSPHGRHDPNVQNCTGKYELHADENVHIDIGEGVDIFW